MDTETENQDTLALSSRRHFTALFKSMLVDRGFASRDIVHLTRISQPFIDALEEARFEDLPGHVFVRGFIRSICQSIGSDPKELLAAFDAFIAADGKDMAPSGKRRKSLTTIPQKNKKIRDYALFRFFCSIDRKKAFKWLAVPAVFLIAGSAAWFLKQEIDRRFFEPVVSAPQQTSNQPLVSEESASMESIVEEVPESAASSLPSDQISAVEVSTAVPAISPPLPQQTAPASSQVVAVKVLRQAEIKASIDGKEATIKLYEPGDYQFSFEKRADFYLFDTDAVDIQFNHQKLSNLSSFGKTRKLSFVAPSEKNQRL